MEDMDLEDMVAGMEGMVACAPPTGVQRGKHPARHQHPARQPRKRTRTRPTTSARRASAHQKRAHEVEIAPQEPRLCFEPPRPLYKHYMVYMYICIHIIWYICVYIDPGRGVAVALVICYECEIYGQQPVFESVDTRVFLLVPVDICEEWGGCTGPKHPCIRMCIAVINVCVSL